MLFDISYLRFLSFFSVYTKSTIASLYDGKVITLREGSDGVMYLRTAERDSNDPYQLWNMEELGNGNWGSIYNKENGKVMDIMQGNTQAGANVIAYSRSSPTSPNQLWKYVDGFIISQLNDLVLEADDFVTMENRAVEQKQAWFHQPGKKKFSELLRNKDL